MELGFAFAADLNPFMIAHTPVFASKFEYAKHNIVHIITNTWSSYFINSEANASGLLENIE